MRFTFALALPLISALALPAAAFAQSEGPDVPIPVQKCVALHTGVVCTPVRNGDGFAADSGYVRVNPRHPGVPAQSASAEQAPSGPDMTR